jgi:hypothetical protein
VFGSNLIERPIASQPGRGLWAPCGANFNGLDFNRRQTKAAKSFGSARCNFGRALLHLVINHNATGTDARSRPLEGEGCGERQRIWPTRAGHQNEVAFFDANNFK